MTHAVALVSALCGVLALVLAWMAVPRLGVARLVWRARKSRGTGSIVRFRGDVAAVGEAVRAPFSQREAVWVRARLRGVGPEGGTPRVLWEKVLSCRARLSSPRGVHEFDPGTAGTLMLVPREYRQGALRALLPDAPVVARALARAGYVKPPPSAQFFELEEEVLAIGDDASVLGHSDAAGAPRAAPGAPVVVYNVNRWRVVLRTAWGPALALLLALIVLLTGATVLGAWWWLR